MKGLRQTANGTEFAAAPGEPYTRNKTSRVANLDMDEHGEVSGKVDLAFIGDAALSWRQRALRGDDESLRHGLKTELEEMLPHSLEVTVGSIEGIDDYEQPLKVSYAVRGTLGAATGKRLVVPADLFNMGESATFTAPKRANPVYFHYPHAVQDALRVNFRKGFDVEAVPTTTKFDVPRRIAYSMDTTSTPTSFTTHRSYVIGDILYAPVDYPALKTFYGEFEGNDRESVVLKAAPPAAAPAGSPSGN